MHKWFARLCVLGFVIGLSAAGAGAVRAPIVWTRPVDGAVVRAFRAPRTPYGPGHRGVDFAVPPGTAVRAAGRGIVVFAGRIGPSSHVVVLHPSSGWRTGYSFLATVAVRRGEGVGGGTVVGTTGGVGDGHDGTVLHFSLRIGDEYVDPMILFAPVDLATVVHLAPTSGDGSGMGFNARMRPYGNERTALLAGLASDGTMASDTVEPGSPRVRWRRLVRWKWF